MEKVKKILTNKLFVNLVCGLITMGYFILFSKQYSKLLEYCNGKMGSVARRFYIKKSTSPRYYKSIGRINSRNRLKTPQGEIHKKDAKNLKKLGSMIKNITANPIVYNELGELTKDNGVLDFDFNDTRKVKYVVLQEDIQIMLQR